MIDDFFDDDFGQDNSNRSGGIKSFLVKSDYSQKTTSKKLSDLVNQTKKLALEEKINENKQPDKELEYTENFEDDENEVPKHAQTVSDETSETQRTYSDSRANSSKSKGKSTTSNSSNSNRNKNSENSEGSPENSQTKKTLLKDSLKKTTSEVMGNNYKSDAFLEIGKSLQLEKESARLRLQNDTVFSESEEKSENINERPVLARKYSQTIITNKKKVAEWMECKRKEELIRRRERRNMARDKLIQEEKEKEKAKKQEEERKKRIEKAIKEWHEMKNGENRIARRRRQEKAEDATRESEARCARSSRSYEGWLTRNYAHRPPRTRHMTAYARTGDRLVTYFDRARSLPPSCVNPHPWRRL